MAKKSKSIGLKKPLIFEYHDYREYLKDWFAFKKASQSDFSMRYLVKETGLSLGSLSMVISGTKGLSQKSMEKIINILALKPIEQNYFELLYTMAEGASSKERSHALHKLQRSSLYRNKNPQEFEVYHYLTHWYYVAIREMVNLEGFKLETRWIQNNLRFKISLSEIDTALKFLTSNGFIKTNDKGIPIIEKKPLKCIGGVYKLALTKFQHEMLALASRSIDSVPAQDRYLKGYTFSIEEEQLDEAKKIVDKAIQELAKIEKKAKLPKATYHTSFALFPLTNSSKRGDS